MMRRQCLIGVDHTLTRSHAHTLLTHTHRYKPDCELPKDMFAFAPNGKGKLITWTVTYKKKPEGTLDKAMVIGEMTSGPDKGKRFVANSKEGDVTTLEWLVAACRIGEEVDVVCNGEKMKLGSNGIFRVWFAKPPGSKSRL